MKLFLAPPTDAAFDDVQHANFRYVQIDAIGVALINAAMPFLPVFLTRLGASSFEVGLLSSMPAFTGLLLAIPIGQFLQNQRNIVPWFTFGRLGYFAAFALTGLLGFLLKDRALILAILFVWGLATVPQTILSITFSVVMNAVTGPLYRFALMARRWSIMGFTSALTVLAVGFTLDRTIFPINYQVVFPILALGGLASYFFSSRIKLKDIQVHSERKKMSLKENAKEYGNLVTQHASFRSFITKRFIFLSGQAMLMPIIPLYLVRQIKASDSWIATNSMVQTAVLIIGYYLWSKIVAKRGSRVALNICTLGAAIYPFLLSQTQNLSFIVMLAAFNGIFQAGLNLVFFDELMKTVPDEYSSTFVALAQGFSYFSSVFFPLFATTIGDKFSLVTAMIISGILQLIGFIMFFRNWPAYTDSKQELSEIS